MQKASRLSDQTSHAGKILPRGVSTVLIGGLPAAVLGDLHACGLTPAHPPSPFITGSNTVLIGGKPALRIGDKAGCGAIITTGYATVEIG